MTRSLTRRALGCLALALAMALAGCTGTPGRVEQPLTRKFAWFSYLNGDDLRRRCGAGQWEVRLVYNGNYDTQVRAYDLVADGAGGAYLTARATPRDYGSLTRLSLRDPLRPYRWRIAEARLNDAQRAELEAALRASGVYGPTPEGLRLRSWAWYWVAVACRDGEVFFNAWTYPSPRWDDLRLREALLPHDDTGVPFTAPKRAEPFRPRGSNPDEKGGSPHFELRVGADGLTDTLALF